MTKQVICLAIASIIIILTEHYLKPILKWVLQSYDWVLELLKPIFSHGYIAQVLAHALPLFILPLVFTGLIAAVYWMFKRAQLAYFSEVLWMVWIIMTVMLILRA